jgi:hypothetical protein
MIIKSTYTDIKNPGSFSGLTGFLKNNKEFTLDNIKKSLLNEPAYVLHKSIKRKFRRAKTIVNDIDECWQIDLVDVSNLKSKKLGQFYNYLLVCIDVFSKYAFVEPMKNKTANETSRAFKIMLKSGRVPQYVYSDRGKEFLGEFKELLKSLKINQIFTKSIHKASVVERLNRTLKERMYRLITYQKNNNYIKILKNLVDSYNNSFHSSIKMKPVEVTTLNKSKVFNNLYGDQYSIDNPISIDFKIGQYVRKVVEKTLFEKGYTPNWSNELFIVDSIIPSNPARYKLKNLNGELLPNNYYYKEELQKVNFEEFPYDTFKLIDKTKSKFQLQKVNSIKNTTIWIDRNNINKYLVDNE